MLRAVVDVLLPPRCLACATLLSPQQLSFCTICSEQLVPQGASFAYVEPLSSTIRRAKYDKDKATAQGLAQFWAAHVVASAALVDVDAVAFVPAHVTRRLARGFDFPAVLARALSASTKTPLLEALQASRRDPRLAQAADRDARAQMVAGRFIARPALAPFKGKRIAVVDDVTTTGATLAAACAVIEGAGATAVGVTLAVTPLHEDGVVG